MLGNKNQRLIQELYRCAHEYDQKLCGYSFLILSDCNQGCFETNFTKANFQHFTGVSTSKMSKTQFYDLCKNKCLSPTQVFAGTHTKLKLAVFSTICNLMLNKSGKIDSCIFPRLSDGWGIGNSSACLVFRQGKKKRYFPESFMQFSIHRCVKKTWQVVAIFKKDAKQKQYGEIIYPKTITKKIKQTLIRESLVDKIKPELLDSLP